MNIDMGHITGADDVLYGVAAIAKALGIPKRAAQHQVDTNRLPIFHMGRKVCIRRSSLKAWIEQQELVAKEGRPNG